jgi:transcriptional regulator with XRE-family HTH domain
LASTEKHPRNAVGPAVRRHRTAYGWSQAQLAARCQLAGWDISRGIVAAIEGRVRWVGDFEAAVLAHVLKTSLVSLFPEKINWREFKALAVFSSGNPNTGGTGKHKLPSA